jgi:glycosyltransferase involved in cell wall biosynthesis
MRGEGQSLLSREGVADLCWLPGERSDVPEILQGLNCFVLPSRNEGISNGILEAMACGLPVIATHVGGNPELVEPGRTGELVPASNPEELAKRILAYSRKPESARMAGRVALARAEQLFSLNTMVQRYSDLYDAQLASLAPQYQRVRTV